MDGGESRGEVAGGKVRRIGSLNHSGERRLDSIRELVILAGPGREGMKKRRERRKREERRSEREEGSVLG